MSIRDAFEIVLFGMLVALLLSGIGWIWLIPQMRAAHMMEEPKPDPIRDADTFPTEMIRDAGELLRMAGALSTVRWKRSHERYLERDRRPRRASRRPFRRVH